MCVYVCEKSYSHVCTHPHTCIHACMHAPPEVDRCVVLLVLNHLRWQVVESSAHGLAPVRVCVCACGCVCVCVCVCGCEVLRIHTRRQATW